VIGQLYVQQYFQLAAKQKMLALVENLRRPIRFASNSCPGCRRTRNGKPSKAGRIPHQDRLSGPVARYSDLLVRAGDAFGNFSPG